MCSREEKKFLIPPQDTYYNHVHTGGIEWEVGDLGWLPRGEGLRSRPGNPYWDQRPLLKAATTSSTTRSPPSLTV
jgi:hypothetical protein